MTDAGISGAQADDSSWAVASFGKDFEYNVRVMKFNMGPVTGQQLAVSFMLCVHLEEQHDFSFQFILKIILFSMQ